MDDDDLLKMVEAQIRNNKKLAEILKQFNIDNRQYTQIVKQLRTTSKTTLSDTVCISH